MRQSESLLLEGETNLNVLLLSFIHLFLWSNAMLVVLFPRDLLWSFHYFCYKGKVRVTKHASNVPSRLWVQGVKNNARKNKNKTLCICMDKHKNLKFSNINIPQITFFVHLYFLFRKILHDVLLSLSFFSLLILAPPPPPLFLSPQQKKKKKKWTEQDTHPKFLCSFFFFSF